MAAVLHRGPSTPRSGREGRLPELLPGSSWPPAGALRFREAARRPQPAFRQCRHEPGRGGASPIGGGAREFAGERSFRIGRNSERLWKRHWVR